MKVGIIAANNIRFSPYIFYYTSILDKLDIDYELIYPDRTNVDDTFQAVTHLIKWNSRIPTALAYYEYIKSVKQVINKEKYELLIVLTMNNAVYMARWLKKSYFRKYIVDIRDYTHENIPIYFNLEKIAVSNSLLNVISSSKFVEFLPEGQYITCHNMRNSELVCAPVINKDKQISIAYIGKGAYLENCARICEKVSRDSRFRFLFYGLKSIPVELEPFQGFDNIEFNGIFAPDEKESIIRGIDILFNVYGNGSPLLDYALSNKLYDAFVYGKPILTSPKTYMSEMAGPYAFDIDLNNPSFLDDLYYWYTALNEEMLISYGKRMLKRIEEEENNTTDIIEKAIKSFV